MKEWMGSESDLSIFPPKNHSAKHKKTKIHLIFRLGSELAENGVSVGVGVGSHGAIT